MEKSQICPQAGASWKQPFYSLLSNSDTTMQPCFLLIFFGLWTCTGVASSRIMFFKEENLLLNFHSSKLYLLFTFSCAFTGRGAIYRKRIVFRAARNKLIYEGARAKLLQLICEVAQIFHYCYFRGSIYLLNVDNTVSQYKRDFPNLLKYPYNLNRAWVVT